MGFFKKFEDYLGQRNTHWLLFQWEDSNPAYLTLQLTNTAQKQIWGFYSNTSGADTAPDKAVTTTELRGGPAQPPVQDLVTTTPVTPPIKGIMASIY